MKIADNAIVASVVMMATPFYGDIFSAAVQVSAKSLMPLLLSSLGVAS
ncbi:MAG: hypothetical protein KGH88_04745 [Thaumarchaeota archaeon]|nr:hypothetical protein [Nitrososphaerota archaeon]